MNASDAAAAAIAEGNDAASMRPRHERLGCTRRLESRLGGLQRFNEAEA